MFSPARCSAVGLAMLLMGAAAVARAQALPDLNPDAFPPVSRASIAGVLAAARAHPDDAPTVGRLGMLLMAWEQWESAAAVLERARSLERRYDWAYLEGIAETRMARHARAAALFREAVDVEPTLPARLALADALFEAGSVDASEPLYRALVREPAAEPHARYGLGRVLAARGDNQGALAELDQAVRLFPDFGAAWYSKGLALRNLGRIEEAQQALARAQQLGARWPGVDDPLMARVRTLRDDPSAHLDRGLALDRRGDLDGAIREHEAAVAADPSYVQAHINLISLYGRKGDPGRAEAHYREVLRLGSHLAEAHYNYGVLLMLQGRTDEAAPVFKQALEANPQHAGAWNNLGQIAERQGRLDEAITDYRRALEQAPGDDAMRFNLGRMLIATRQYPEAIAQFETLASVETPARPRYVFGLATAWVLSGDLQKGRRYALEARQLAETMGQSDLVAAIDRDLARLPQ